MECATIDRLINDLYNYLCLKLKLAGISRLLPVFIINFMLPRIPDAHRDVVPYHAFSHELLLRKTSQNNFAKLKLMKEFLDDEQY